MHKKAIVHIMTKARMKSDAFTSEINGIEELSEKYGIKNVIYYKGDTIEYKDLINKLEKFGILLYNYSNKEELKEKIIEFNKQFEVIFISTPLELQVNIVNEIKEVFGRPISKHPDIFRDKHLQRELIQKYNPELGIKFLKGSIEELDIKRIEKKVGYPFIIKPVDGLQSSGVAKISSKKDYLEYTKTYTEFHDRLKNRGVDTKMLIAEEFIDGKMYSIDYYVDHEGNCIVSKPVKVKLGVDFGFNDYCNVARVSTEKTEKEFRGKRLKTFINSTIKATGIKNVFIHHEFKINSKGLIKTIELNGRIGGGRLDLMKRAYNFNLYELLVNSDLKAGKLKENNIVVNIYATKRGILEGFNKNLFEKISNRKTVFKIEQEECYIGKEIGLTRDGFVKVGAIKLASTDYKEIRKDFLYIKSKYAELLLINKLPEKKKKGIFTKIKSIFSKKK